MTPRAVAEEPAPHPNVGDAADAVEEEQAPSEPTSKPTIPIETVQPEEESEDGMASRVRTARLWEIQRDKMARLRG